MGLPYDTARCAKTDASYHCPMKRHCLRHTAAVHMADGGVPMSQIAQFLGHSSTTITERVYARYSPDHLTDAASILDFAKPRLVR